MRVLVNKESGFDRISLEDVYIFGFHQTPNLELGEVAIDDPDYPLLSPGDRLIYIGGKKSSAGYKVIDLIDCSMEYCGLVRVNEFELLCFRLYKFGKMTDPDFKEGYADAYYGWLRLSRSRWFVSNTAGSGRVIETTKVLLSTKPVH